MDRTDLGGHRILIVSAKTHATGLLRSILGMLGVTSILQVEDGSTGLECLKREGFTAVFCSPNVAPISGLTFPVAARRHPGMVNPTVPIFMLQERARRRDV